MKKTTAIVWDHRGRVPKGGKGQLEVRVTVDRKSYYFGTGIKVHKSEFVAGQIINCPGAKALNDQLAIIYTKVLACVNESMENGTTIDTEDVRQRVWHEVENNSGEPTLLNWIEEQIPMLNVKEGTRKHYYPLVTRLMEFGKMTRWQDVTVENIYKFDAWLHTVTKPLSDAKRKAGAKPEPLSAAGIYNYHKTLKALLRRAYSMGKIEENPYSRLIDKFDRGESENVEFLTEDEIRAFEALQLPEGSVLMIVKDLFVFQLYTGLSYSDTQAFDISKYKWDGEHWRHVGERIKTGVPFVSTLLPPVVKVLEKYGWEVPKIDNADYNRHLKSLAVMAGIKTRMHTHLARHTFATTMLSNDVKIQNVQRMLGHKNIQQTQRYAKVLAKDVHDDFDMIEKKMKKKSNPKK